MKILLLEDDIMLNEAITQYLSSVGHKIRSVKDGEECLQILQEEKFDLLILDINVPSVYGSLTRQPPVVRRRSRLRRRL